MTRKETTAIALKCFAIYIMVQMIINIPSFVSIGMNIGLMMDKPEPTPLTIIIPSLSIIIGFAIAFFLWKTTNSILEKETDPSADQSDIGVDEVVKLVLGCMGIYFIIDAIIVLPGAIASLANLQNTQFGYSLMFFSTQILELIFGALLVTKPGKWLKIIRSAGTEK
jgi:hypothetical protein